MHIVIRTYALWWFSFLCDRTFFVDTLHCVKFGISRLRKKPYTIPMYDLYILVALDISFFQCILCKVYNNLWYEWTSTLIHSYSYIVEIILYIISKKSRKMLDFFCKFLTGVSWFVWFFFKKLWFFLLKSW